VITRVRRDFIEEKRRASFDVFLTRRAG